MKLFSVCAGAALALLAGCQRPEEIATPRELVPKPQLAQVLADIHLAEVRVDASRLSTDSAQALFLQVKDSLLRHHRLSDSAFAQTYRYYTIHEKDLQEVYDQVLDTLAARSARIRPDGTPAPPPPPYRRILGRGR